MSRASTRLRGFAGAALPLVEAVAFCVAVALPASVRAQPVFAPQLVPQSGHSDKIRTLAWSPDGRFIASAGSDRRIKLWEAASGALLRTLTGARKRVETVSFSPDGRWLAATGPDSTLRVWSLDTGELAATQARTQIEAPAVAFSPDGSRLAWAVGSQVELWNPGLQALSGRLQEKAAVVSVAWSGDGRTLAAGTSDSSIGLWDVGSGARRAALADRKESATSIAWSPDGARLVSTSGSEIVLWDVAAGRPRQRVQGHTAPVLAVAWSRDGARIASSAGDNTARLWDPDGAALHVLKGHAGRFGWVYAVAFSPDGARLASAGEDATVRLWSVRDGAEQATLGGRADRVESASFSSDGRRVAIGGLGIDSELQIWDMQGGGLARTLVPPDRGSGGPPLTAEEERFAAESLEKSMHAADKAQFEIRSPRLNFSGGIWAHGETMRRILAGFPGTVRSVAFSPGGERLFSGSLSRVVRVWDPEGGSQLRALTAHSGVVRAVAVSPDGRRFASGGEDGSVKVWNASNFYLHRNLPRAHKGPVAALAFSPDSRWLATAAENDAQIGIWDVESGSLVRGLPAQRGGVDALAFAPDGRTLASVGVDTEAGKNSLWLWDPESGRDKRRATLDGWPLAVAFSPDGRTVAVATHGGTIELRDPEGQLLRTLTGHSGPVWSVAWSPSGQLVISGGDDTTTRYWCPHSGELLATATGRGADWLVTAPDGLFDGSPAGWGDVRWRFSSALADVAPVELFFGEFYSPGLLAELVAGRRPRAPRVIGELDRRQPQVALHADGATSSVSARTVAIGVRVTEAGDGAASARGSGARDVRLFRNGSLVKVWRGDLLLGKASVTLQAEVPVVAGENRFTAYAFNRDNIKSADAELLVRGDTSLLRKGTAFILAIGIDRYRNADYDLRYAVADATAFAETLQSEQARLGSYASVELVPLLDREATKANILGALGRLAGAPAPLARSGARSPGAPAMPGSGEPPAFAKLRRAQPEDAVFVYFAGHGTASGPSFYLIPHDLGYAGKRSALDASGLELILSHGISDRELELAFEGIDAGRLLLVIDACNSGQALEADERRRGPMNSKGLAQLAYEKGMYVLTASQGYQAALEVQQLGHGLLTYALVEEGLKREAADSAPKDGQVVLREWLNYATGRVPELQGEAMREARSQGRELAFVAGEEARPRLEERSLQRPRVFYRREPEREPFVVAKAAPRP